MTDERKSTEKESRKSCEAMPFARMMKNMMGEQGPCCGDAEMMSQMMEKMQAGKDPMALCREMMGKMSR